MLRNHLGFVLSVICCLYALGDANDGVLQRALPNGPAKVDLSKLNCARFRNDLDLVHQLPFPVLVHSEDDEEDYWQNIAVLYRNSTSVKTLYIYEDAVVPSSIFCLSKLQELQIHDTPFLNDIVPDALANLRDLRELYIYNTRIVKMTDELGSLLNMSMIILSNCSLTSLPNLSKLEQLYALDLNNNQLSQLNTIPAVKFLRIDENRFNQIPLINNRDAIQYLGVSNNAVKSATEIMSYPNLIGLDMKNTSLTSIPATIDRLKSLQSLDFSNNQISDITPNIHKLPALESLAIENNRLSPKKIQEIQKAFQKSHPNLSLAI